MSKKLKKKIKSEGLPGGPNERIYSSMGYLPNSPDRNNPYNIIPSNQITMEGVPFPILGIDDLGNQQMMYPGMNYTFPGNEVFELPIKQTGGSLPEFQDDGEVQRRHEARKSTADERRFDRANAEFKKLKREYKDLIINDPNQDLNYLKRKIDILVNQQYRDKHPSTDVSVPQTDPVLQALQYKGILNENTAYSPILGTTSVTVPVDSKTTPGDIGARSAHAIQMGKLPLLNSKFKYDKTGNIEQIKGVKEQILGYEPIEGSNFQFAKISDARLPEGYKTMVVPKSKEYEEEFNKWNSQYDKTEVDKLGYVYPHYENKKSHAPLNKKQYGGNMDNSYKKTDMINSQNPFEKRKNNFMDFLKSNSQIAQMKEFETLQKEYNKFLMKCGGIMKKYQYGAQVSTEPVYDKYGYIIE